MKPFRIALAQINTTVGDIAGNARKILDSVARARAAGAAIYEQQIAMLATMLEEL